MFDLLLVGVLQQLDVGDRDNPLLLSHTALIPVIIKLLQQGDDIPLEGREEEGRGEGGRGTVSR